MERKAQYLFQQKHIDESPETRENRIVCAYAFAISEQNADGGIIVTAPTCGACSVLPSVLRYMQEQRGIAQERVLRALAVAGLIGDLIKTNASISGAECGCQAEIGSACAMAAAALGELFEMGIDQIEYAAEVALEHHLGLTCDPICGLVQIPCIERNAVAAMRAINAVRIANFLTATRKYRLTPWSGPCTRPAATSPGATARPPRAGWRSITAAPEKKVRPARKILQISVAPGGQTVL